MNLIGQVINNTNIIMHESMIIMAGGLGRKGSYIAGTTVILLGSRRRPVQTTFQEAIKGMDRLLQKFSE